MHEQLRLVASLSDAELLSRVETQAATDRADSVALIASLAEVDARRLYLGLGYASLYAYCTRHLHFSEHAAYTRIEAARTARRFPVVLDLLMAGDLTMTTVALLGRYLTDANHLTLLEAARHKTKREVQAQVADLDPPPDLDSIVAPLGNGRYRIEVTVSDDTYRDLCRLQELMRHAVPTGDPAEFVARGLSLLREQVERRRLADVHRPRTGRQSSGGRHVPASVRRAVWARDGAQCAFVGTAGRCRERSYLELHHVVPFTNGGETSVDNLQLRCRAHNQYEAAQAGLSRPAAAARQSARSPAAPTPP